MSIKKSETGGYIIKKHVINTRWLEYSNEATEDVIAPHNKI